MDLFEHASQKDQAAHLGTFEDSLSAVIAAFPEPGVRP